MTERIYNFAAGPAVLPLPVLEEVRDNLLSLPGVGMSILEISHRSKVFEEILNQTVSDIKSLAGIGDDYHVLFIQGGASMQFSMVPMNILPASGSADYIMTGAWSKKAAKEAQKVSKVNIAASTESEGFKRVPAQNEIKLDPAAAYVHITTNNTIFGTEWRQEPDAGSVPLVADTSSDMFSRPIEVNRYGLIYAGAQKNLGPAGVTLVIIRDDLLKRSPQGLPTMMDYNTYAKENSLYNTPPTFAIYIVGLVMRWIKNQGGLTEIGRRNEEKARVLYDQIDSTGFYRGHAKADSRSQMNVTFRLPSEELEKQFVSEATRAGLDGLKGHRSVGGCRASIYNAFPLEGVQALVSFMKEYERTHG
ncbi:MAG TPA: 3-phosphoserine/phosphohydroxythreonine transaminase [Blastocatellia bacterium]|nr:3-phosphoserine/phosphohydroxythreonine transaminase [Blastocatellia bacterium]